METPEPAARIAELEARIRSLEAALARAVEELARIQGSRWWRLAAAYWRWRARWGLVAAWFRHPLGALRTLAARILPLPWRRRILDLVRSSGGPPAVDPGGEGWAGTAEAPAGKPATLPVVLVLPAVPWTFRRQRPHHLATALARLGWPVTWVLEEPAGGSRVEPGNVLAPGVRGLHLPLPRRLASMEGVLGGRLAGSLVRALLDWQLEERVEEVIVLCGSPFWGPLATGLEREGGWRLVYDLIDLHDDFPGAPPGLGRVEEELLATADLVTVTSAVLEERARARNPRVRRVPNACDWEVWSRASAVPLPGSPQGPVIGYFGAISEWFDASLVEFLASRRPQWSFFLVGDTWGGRVGRLERMENVHLPGEVPYEDLPSLAAGFHAGIVPFRDEPLVRATDPVKVYEMLALGLRVVATPLPELERFRGLVDVAGSPEEFLERLDDAVRLPVEPGEVEHRREFARANSWEERARFLDRELRELYPLASIVVVTFNNVPLTRMCLESLRSRTVYPNFEVIVVDNGSTDGTTEYLRSLADDWPALQVIENGVNRGFAAANNQGLRAARGEILVLLNNDTVVTRGWLCSMVRALERNPRWGLVGAVTNAIGNEARIPVGYDSLEGLDRWAGEHTWSRRGRSFPLSMAALYCAAFRREVLEAVGELDERFEVGMFEDDDFSRRVRRAGYEIRCLEDCFVHHWQQASFRLLDPAEVERIYEANRRRYREKWAKEEGALSRSGREG